MKTRFPFLTLACVLALTIASCDSGVTPDAASPEVSGDAFSKGPKGKDMICHVGSETVGGLTYLDDPDCIPDKEAEVFCPDAGKIDLIEASNPSKHFDNPEHCWPLGTEHCDYDPDDVGASGEGTEDGDGDGIDDGCDVCPNDPDNDADKDGVCGDVDLCPEEYGEGPDGCPAVDPCAADPNSIACANYCVSNPAAPECGAACEEYPESAACDIYCSSNSIAPECGVLCGVDPNSGICIDYCEYYNWEPEACPK